MLISSRAVHPSPLLGVLKAKGQTVLLVSYLSTAHGVKKSRRPGWSSAGTYLKGTEVERIRVDLGEEEFSPGCRDIYSPLFSCQPFMEPPDSFAGRGAPFIQHHPAQFNIFIYFFY